VRRSGRFGWTSAQPSSSAILNKDGSGGLLGRTYLGLLTVERFFLPEDFRRNRLGSRSSAVRGRRHGAEDAPARCCPHSIFQAGRVSISNQGGRSPPGSNCEPPAMLGSIDQAAVLTRPRSAMISTVGRIHRGCVRRAVLRCLRRAPAKKILLPSIIEQRTSIFLCAQSACPPCRRSTYPVGHPPILLVRRGR